MEEEEATYEKGETDTTKSTSVQVIEVLCNAYYFGCLCTAVMRTINYKKMRTLNQTGRINNQMPLQDHNYVLRISTKR